MVYLINIIINDRNWYDSRINEGDEVVFQNANYADGSDRSINVVRQRFIQDWARRIIPNSVRQGLGLTDPAGGSDQIIVTQGFAVVGGRFLDIPSGTFDASDEGLSSVDHYLVIRVTSFTEGDTRDPTAGTSFLVGDPVSTYTKSHNDLVLAKFSYNGSVISGFEDYTAEQEWQANVISPIAAKPGTTTGSDNILIRAGLLERINILGIETDKARFYISAVLDDQTTSTEVKLINNSGFLEIQNIGATALLGTKSLNIYTGGTAGGSAQRIDSSGNLTNIGTINTRTLAGNSAGDIITTDATQTMTDKTLTSPIQTGGTLNSGAALTVDSTELNQLDAVSVGGNTSGDIITTDDTQTISNKTLTTPIIASLFQDAGETQLMTVPDKASDTFALLAAEQTLQLKTLETLTILDADQSNDIIFLAPDFSGTRTIIIPTNLDDISSLNEIVMTGLTQTLTGKSIDQAQITGDLTVSRGGTGVGTFTDGGILFGNLTSDIQVSARPTFGQLLVGQTSGNPLPKTPSITLTGEIVGSDSMDDDGDYSIDTDLVVPTTTIFYPIDMNLADISGGSDFGFSLEIPLGASAIFRMSLHDDMFGLNFAYTNIKLTAITFFTDGGSGYDIFFTYKSGLTQTGTGTESQTGDGVNTFNIADQTILGHDNIFIRLDTILGSQMDVWSGFLTIEVS